MSHQEIANRGITILYVLVDPILDVLNHLVFNEIQMAIIPYRAMFD